MKKLNKKFSRVIGMILVFAMMFSVGTSVMAADKKIQPRTSGNGYESLLNWTYFFYDTSKNVVSSPFGPRGGDYHAGIDVIGPSGIDGTAIRSVDSGTVAQTYLNVSGAWHSTFGYAVSIQLDGRVPYTTNTLHALYMHMKYSPEVTTGSRVSDGALLGYVGMSGLDPNNPDHGPHLHFQVTTNGQPYAPYGDCLNPALFFPGILPQSRSVDALQDNPAMYEYSKDDILIPMEIVDHVGLENVKTWVRNGGLAGEDTSTAARKIISEFSVPAAVTRNVIL